MDTYVRGFSFMPESKTDLQVRTNVFNLCYLPKKGVQGIYNTYILTLCYFIKLLLSVLLL